jgi:transposase
MDPFHVVRLAGDALDECRRRIQHNTRGHRGRKTDPLFASQRNLHTGADLLTTNRRRDWTSCSRQTSMCRSKRPGAYQRMINAYRDPNTAQGSKTMQALIDSLRHGVPTALIELHRLGRTLSRRAADVLAYFDQPGTSNGPTEAINGRLEHLRGSALGFRNLTTTSPDHCSKQAASAPPYTAKCDEPQNLAKSVTVE